MSDWADITQAIGPWEGGGRQSIAYDIDVLGAGYDPHNVLTNVCTRCRDRYAYDSPTSECRYCERERLIDLLMEDRAVARAANEHRKKKENKNPPGGYLRERDADAA